MTPQELIARSEARLERMIDGEFPEILIEQEKEHLARLWNITGEVGEC